MSVNETVWSGDGYLLLTYVPSPAYALAATGVMLMQILMAIAESRNDEFAITTVWRKISFSIVNTISESIFYIYAFVFVAPRAWILLQAIVGTAVRQSFIAHVRMSMALARERAAAQRNLRSVHAVRDALATDQRDTPPEPTDTFSGASAARLQRDVDTKLQRLRRLARERRTRCSCILPSTVRRALVRPIPEADEAFSGGGGGGGDGDDDDDDVRETPLAHLLGRPMRMLRPGRPTDTSAGARYRVLQTVLASIDPSDDFRLA